MHICLYIYIYTRNRVTNIPLIAIHAPLIYTYSYISIHIYHMHIYACTNVLIYISIWSLTYHSLPHVYRSYVSTGTNVYTHTHTNSSKLRRQRDMVTDTWLIATHTLLITYLYIHIYTYYIYTNKHISRVVSSDGKEIWSIKYDSSPHMHCSYIFIHLCLHILHPYICTHLNSSKLRRKRDMVTDEPLIVTHALLIYLYIYIYTYYVYINIHT